MHTTSSAQRARPLTPVVFRFGRLGDMVMLSAVVRFLRARFGARCIVIGAGAWNLRVYEEHPDVAQVWSFARHVPFMLSLTWWRVAWMLHRTAPGPIFVCERHPRQLVRIRRMLALSGVDRRRCLFITDYLPAPSDSSAPASPALVAGSSQETLLRDPHTHWIDRLVSFAQMTPAALSALEYPPPEDPARRLPALSVGERERVSRDVWLRERGWSDRPLILVQPGNFRSMSKRRERWERSQADDKAWPVARWAELLRSVHAAMPAALIVLCGAPQEGRMLRRIEAACDCTAVVSAELPLRALLALCESAHSMISIDTGPAHAAAALGLPLVVMYGTESPRHWLPRGPSGSPILGVGGPPSSTHVEQISVEAVLSAWRALVARTA